MLSVSYAGKNAHSAGKTSGVLRVGASGTNRCYALTHCVGVWNTLKKDDVIYEQPLIFWNNSILIDFHVLVISQIQNFLEKPSGNCQMTCLKQNSFCLIGNLAWLVILTTFRYLIPYQDFSYFEKDHIVQI